MKYGVIGGGIYGVTTAYYLKHFGADEVILFEKGNLASESTGYSAGIVRHHYSNDIQVRMAKRGREILEDLDDLLGQDGGFHQNGYLILSDETEEDEFRKIVKLQKELGIDVDFVESDELDEYLPAIDPTDVAVAALDRQAGFADPYLVTMGFADKAQELGVDIRTQTRVTDIETDGREPATIETASKTFDVDYVVNAAGPWGRDVGEMVGLNLPLKQYESKIVVLESSSPYGPDLPTLSDHAMKPDMYTKPEPGGDFLVGGIDRPPVDPEQGLEGVTNAFLEEVGRRIERRLPGYSDARVTDSWSGVITVTPDAIQIAGVPDELDNFFNIVGGSGHGFKEAVSFSESIAQTILGQEPEIDLTPYRLERFNQGEGFTGISTETYSES